jgi:uncharacterized membrane protein (DUF373 family)
MSNTHPGVTITNKFKIVVVVAVAILLLLSVTIAIFVLYVLFINGIRTHLTAVHSVVNMQGELQRVFAGVLLVLLGLELLETLKTYFTDESIRIEVILIVAMIGVGRHILNIDLEHTSALTLLGAAALILALALSYFLIKRTQLKSAPADQESDD